MKYSFLIFLIFFAPGLVEGQRLIKAENFVINTPFLEPEERVLTQNLGKDGFITIAKNKGTTKGPSTYFLEHRRPDLSVKWRTPLRVADNENILHLEVIGQEVVLFTMLHDERQKKSVLQSDKYSKNDGQHITDKMLLEHKIENWNAINNKGTVVRDFDTNILSRSKRGYITPLEYRYKIAISQDTPLILFYRYDYSKPNLLVEAYVFSRELELVKNAILPIDKGFINHGLSLSPNGNLFLLNAKSDGTVAVVYFDLEDKRGRFLEISPSNSNRAHFKLIVEDEFNAMVSFINLRNNLLEGVSFSRFNFKNEQIDWVHFQDLTKSLDSLSISMGEKLQKNNYELIHVAKTNSGNLVILEQRQFLAPVQQYDPSEGDDKDYWKQGKDRIELGNVLLVFFDHQNDLKWIHAISKNQTNISDEGLIINSFNYEIFEDHIQIIFSVGIGSVSQLNHLSADWEGNISRNELPNEHSIILLRPYTLWQNPEDVIIVGKKGISGKSSVILKYRVP